MPFVLGSISDDVESWANLPNDELLEGLTGTIRELTSADFDEEIDRRYSPIVEEKNRKILPVVEGYRLVEKDIISSPVAIPLKNDDKIERKKRETMTDNTSFVAAQSSSHDIHSVRLTDNLVDDGTLISEDDADAFVRNLALTTDIDGSGMESKFNSTRTFFFILESHATSVHSLFSITSKKKNRNLY